MTQSKHLNFWQLPLSNRTRRKFASIDESRVRSPCQKMALVDKLLASGHDLARGLYVPLSSHVFLLGKLTENFADLPQRIEADKGTPLCFFGNPLLLPEGHGKPAFDIERSLKPIQRATNAGFVVVTVEHDCQTREEFQAIVAWTTPSLAFKQVDDELRKYKEYCGYNAVLSGNKSVHFHFVFDTRHLAKAPYDASYQERLALQEEQSAIMHNVHQLYWDRANDVMNKMLKPPLAPDLSARSYTQFKRMPWGVRKLDKHSDLLDLPLGTLVPQLVLLENIRASRSAKGSESFLVPPDYSPRLYPRRNHSRGHHARLDIAGHGDAMLQELALLCQLEWNSEFPKPVLMEQIKGEWVIRFRNHHGDRTPSTIARGSFSSLLLVGNNAPPGKFRLPGGLTAQELAGHLARRFALTPPVIKAVTSVATEALTSLERLKSLSGIPLMQAYESRAKRSFPIYCSRSVAEMRMLYRDKLAAECAAVRAFGLDHLILSAEGIGKTYALFSLMAEEALDTAMSHDDQVRRFFCFACKSIEQATAKAAEYENEHRRAVLVKSFWRHYAETCENLGKTPIKKQDFDEDTNIVHVLDVIRTEQPTVFVQLERKRRSLWTNEAGEQLFNGATMLFTSHATVKTWNESHLTRIWHHPDFEPTNGRRDTKDLRTEFAIEKVVFDELEPDDFVHLLTPKIFRHLSSVRPGWKGMPRSVKRDVYRKTIERGVIPSSMTFEEYSELRYLDPATLQEVKVDFDYAPFGRKNSAQSIYRDWHGRSFYLGCKAWPFSTINWTFLTTERWVTEIVSAVYRKQQKKPLIRLELDDLPGVFPVHVPVSINPSARAKDIQMLTQEILNSSADAAVIADGLGWLKGDRAKSYLGMKGHNGFSQKDVYSIVTFLAPEVYARLNVMGQWIGQRDPIAQHYMAQISQAVGRNTAFRQKADTKTVIVASGGLLRLIRSDLERLNSRVVLQPSPERFW
ncbi:hypothetical protein ACVWZK_001472 [Bradyrhizobium sp. GM0.4]